MDDAIPFASPLYFFMLAILSFSRAMDFFSTWVATPNLVLEGNPLAKKLGWRWGILLNLVLIFVLASWILPAIVISTTSLLVAARNFQSAWLMRSLGEHQYQAWHIERFERTHPGIYLLCLFGQTLLTAAVGGAVIYFSESLAVPTAIGLGIVAYAFAVLFYSLLSLWRIRRKRVTTTVDE